MKERIKYISRKNLSIEKYDQCIKQATNGLTYAYSWYLNCVTDDWGALILEEYKAVMPIPYLKLKRNLYLKKIYQPNFCQQLGIFSKTDLDSAETNLFLTAFLALKPKSYSFNFQNSKYFSKGEFKFKERINYELDLNQSYDTIRLSYNKNLKRNLKKAQKNDLSLSNTINVSQFLKLKKENSKHNIKENQYTLMKALTSQLIKQNKAAFYGVLKGKQLLAIGFFITTNNRIIALFSVSNELGRSVAATAFLFDQLIQKNAKTSTVFDFEGSMNSGIAQFFKSFGATNNSYICLPC